MQCEVSKPQHWVCPSEVKEPVSTSGRQGAIDWCPTVRTFSLGLTSHDAVPVGFAFALGFGWRGWLFTARQ